MQHFTRNLFLVLTLLVVCALAIIPPSEKLRKGRDLAGAVSLTYAVQLEPGADATEAINNTIDVLKNRVDPNGLFEISFARVGRDRIEVSMPLPSDAVKDLRRRYEAELAEVASEAISEDELMAALLAPASEQSQALERLAQGDQERARLLRDAADAWNELQSARRAYLDAEQAFRTAQEQAEEEAAEAEQPADESQSGTEPTSEESAPAPAEAEPAEDAQADAPAIDAPTQEELRELLARVGQAEDRYENAKAEVLALTVSAEDLRAALELPDVERRLRDRNTGDVAALPSPRQTALENIRREHPQSLDAIERVVDAYLAYEQERKGFDDPRDLKRLLRGAGVLSFRIAVTPDEAIDIERLRRELQEQGPRATATEPQRWFEIQDISQWYSDAQELQALQADPASFFASTNRLVAAERDGVYYVLLWDTPGRRLTQAEGEWALAGAFQGVDQMGRPAINFTMDPRGANFLGQLTAANVQKPMAVLLDDKVYTAPNLLGRISRTGQIMGNFTSEDINYITRVLSAGSLQARLSPEPISEVSLAPTLGADNMRAGMRAGLIALIAVAVFMAMYYLGTGFIAVIALAANAVMILGVMSLARAAFTLPGIAGIILTFGMAVDANVLIYERIREEFAAGADLRTAVRLAYQKVLSTIVDANVTNLIVCLVLGYTATVEIRGFAITLGIGIMATLISSLVLSRLIFVLLIDRLGVRRMPQLPQIIPAIERALSPRINWLKLRPVFLVVSSLAIFLGLTMVFKQGPKMLDTELRGGTQMLVQLRRENPDDPASPRVTITRQDVVDRVTRLGLEAAPDSPLVALRNAQVIPVDPQQDQVTSDQFLIKTTVAAAESRDRAVNAIVASLEDVIDSQPPLDFAGASDETAPLGAGVVARITDADLRGNFDRPDLPQIDASGFVGGVAILLENLDPPPTLEALRSRLSQTRAQPPFSDTALGRVSEVFILQGSSDRVQTAAIAVLDPALTFFDDDARWRREVASVEWDLTREALTNATTLASVQSFSPSVAQTLRAQAVVAIVFSLAGILIYIWLRFGSLRYSLAAIAALVHDVLAVIGLVAVAEILYEWSPSLTGALLIEPFKIDLALIAALLTIIGYSLNDTIVILDRIRENRGRLAYASADVVNTSINQTISRTFITSFTTFLAILIMYIWGGQGLRAFTYAMLCGVVIGTYSSVAVAAPLVYSRKGGPRGGAGASHDAQADEAALAAA